MFFVNFQGENIEKLCYEYLQLDGFELRFWEFEFVH